jgi:hypothetical protein
MFVIALVIGRSFGVRKASRRGSDLSSLLPTNLSNPGDYRTSTAENLARQSRVTGTRFRHESGNCLSPALFEIGVDSCGVEGGQHRAYNIGENMTPRGSGSLCLTSLAVFKNTAELQNQG